jgi:hypothetical protein
VVGKESITLDAKPEELPLKMYLKALTKLTMSDFTECSAASAKGKARIKANKLATDNFLSINT